jgi:hypothetical protein
MMRVCPSKCPSGQRDDARVQLRGAHSRGFGLASDAARAAAEARRAPRRRHDVRVMPCDPRVRAPLPAERGAHLLHLALDRLAPAPGRGCPAARASFVSLPLLTYTFAPTATHSCAATSATPPCSPKAGRPRRHRQTGRTPSRRSRARNSCRGLIACLSERVRQRGGWPRRVSEDSARAGARPGRERRLGMGTCGQKSGTNTNDMRRRVGTGRSGGDPGGGIVGGLGGCGPSASNAARGLGEPAGDER